MEKLHVAVRMAFALLGFAVALRLGFDQRQQPRIGLDQ
jgi:hypothetical protein